MQKSESSTFRHWLEGIKDNKTKARITSRINRLMEGLAGDVKPAGFRLSELRLHFGSGYRIYYYQKKDVLVLLLNGGDKKSQSKDIAKAHSIYKLWKEEYERTI